MACKHPENIKSYRFCISCKDNDFCSDSSFNRAYISLSDNDLPFASEANKLTKEHIEKCLTKELKEITEKIIKAIADGKFSISGDGYLKSETKQRLEELGYKVKYGSQYNESYWSISWK